MPVTFAVRGPMAVPSGLTDTAALIAAIGAANIVGCWDAELGITLSGSDVLTWTDQVNGYVLGLNVAGAEPTPSSPVFGATSYNGKAGLTFTLANGDYLATTDAAVSFGTNTSSFFAALTLNNAAALNGRFLSFWPTGSNDTSATGIAAILRDGSNQQLNTYQVGFGTAVGVTYGTPTRFGITCDNTNITPYLNNVAQTARVQPFTLAATGGIGVGDASGGGSGFWDGVTRRIIITKTVLSAGDRSLVDTWLQG